MYYLALVYDSNTNASADINIGWLYDAAGGYAQGRHYYSGAAWTDTAGEDHRFGMWSNALTLADDFSLIVAAQSLQSTVALRPPLSGAGMLANNPTLVYTSTGRVEAGGNDGSERLAIHYTYPLSEFQVWGTSWSKAKSTAKIALYRNGKLVASGNGTAETAHALLAQPFAVGVQIASTGGMAGYFQGLIGPVIMTSSELSAATMAKVSHYLFAMRKLREAV